MSEQPFEEKLAGWQNVIAKSREANKQTLATLRERVSLEDEWLIESLEEQHAAALELITVLLTAWADFKDSIGILERSYTTHYQTNQGDQ